MMRPHNNNNNNNNNKMGERNTFIVLLLVLFTFISTFIILFFTSSEDCLPKEEPSSSSSYYYEDEIESFEEEEAEEEEEEEEEKEKETEEEEEEEEAYEEEFTDTSSPLLSSSSQSSLSHTKTKTLSPLSSPSASASTSFLTPESRLLQTRENHRFPHSRHVIPTEQCFQERLTLVEEQLEARAFMIVSKKYKFMMCVTPKVASTSWLEYIRWVHMREKVCKRYHNWACHTNKTLAAGTQPLNSLNPSRTPRGSDVLANLKLQKEELLHPERVKKERGMNERLPSRYLRASEPEFGFYFWDDLSIDERMQIAKDRSYFKFAIYRHPWARLESGYRSKYATICQHDTKCMKVRFDLDYLETTSVNVLEEREKNKAKKMAKVEARRSRHLNKGNIPTITKEDEEEEEEEEKEEDLSQLKANYTYYQAFVDAVTSSSPIALNPHFKPQSLMCAHDCIPYDALLDLKDPTSSDEITRILNLPNNFTEIAGSGYTWDPTQMVLSYTMKDVAKAYDYFRGDTLRFGFDFNSYFKLARDYDPNFGERGPDSPTEEIGKRLLKDLQP